jgi:hypothetical protein
VIAPPVRSRTALTSARSRHVDAINTIRRSFRVISRRFTSSIPLLPQLETIFEPGSPILAVGARAAYRCSQYVREVMLALLLAITGFALFDSLNPMKVGITTAVVYDSLLRRRSPIPGGLSFVAGVLALNITFGVCTVLGIKILTNLVHFEHTPTIRYWAELAVGLALISLASLPAVARPASPTWAAATMIRRRPWLLGFFGIAVGVFQAPTAFVYLTALAMLSAHKPLPPVWPLIVIAYCAIALLLPLLILALSMRQTPRARRLQRNITRVLARFGAITVRTLFLVIGLVLVADALLHHRDLW